MPQVAGILPLKRVRIMIMGDRACLYALLHGASCEDADLLEARRPRLAVHMEGEPPLHAAGVIVGAPCLLAMGHLHGKYPFYGLAPSMLDASGERSPLHPFLSPGLLKRLLLLMQQRPL